MLTKYAHTSTQTHMKMQTLDNPELTVQRLSYQTTPPMLVTLGARCRAFEYKINIQYMPMWVCILFLAYIISGIEK